MYHFLSGYTAKVAGTEKGVTEPKATFSTCFGAPFLPLPPSRYAKMLGEKIARHSARVWLVNTGWTGGPYGVGTRMKIAHTRAMIRAALSGALDSVELRDGSDLQPRRADRVSRRAGRGAEAAQHLGRPAPPTTRRPAKLARMFVDNFKTFEGGRRPRRSRAAGPRA